MSYVHIYLLVTMTLFLLGSVYSLELFTLVLLHMLQNLACKFSISFFAIFKSVYYLLTLFTKNTAIGILIIIGYTLRYYVVVCPIFLLQWSFTQHTSASVKFSKHLFLISVSHNKYTPFKLLNKILYLIHI